MLQRLTDHIAACASRADHCETRAAAAAAADEDMRQELLRMAKSWRHVAQSYEFVLQLESFLLDAHKGQLVCRVEDLPIVPPAGDDPERAG